MVQIIPNGNDGTRPHPELGQKAGRGLLAGVVVVEVVDARDQEGHHHGVAEKEDEDGENDDGGDDDRPPEATTTARVHGQVFSGGTVIKKL